MLSEFSVQTGRFFLMSEAAQGFPPEAYLKYVEGAKTAENEAQRKKIHVWTEN
jgi:hypothetical protein